ncbi:MAG: Ig-like domain-containing protein [Thermoleophilia bacterium]
MKYLIILAFLVAIFAIGAGSFAIAANPDTTAPLVANVVPADGSIIYTNSGSTIYYQIGNTSPMVIKADYSDEAGGSGIDPGSVMVHLDGGNMLFDCPVQTETHVECLATAADLFPGTHPVDIYVSDLEGNETINRTWVTVVIDNAVPTYSNLTPASGSTIYTSQLNSASINDMSALRFDYNISDPAPSSGASPMSHINDSFPPGDSMGAMISNASCVKTPDANNPIHYSCQVNRAGLLHLGDNTLSVLLKDRVGNSNYSDLSSVNHYTVVDNVAPAISNIAADPTNITATYTDPSPTGALSTNLASGINSATAMIHVDGAMIMTGCTATATGISCPIPSGLAAGTHAIEVIVKDNAGNTGTGTGSFTDNVSRDYYWARYDGVNSLDFMILGNPPGSGPDLSFDLYLGTSKQNLAPFTTGLTDGKVPAGKSITPIFTSQSAVSPVKAVSTTGDKAIASQRILWKGKYFEEVPGTESSRLSSCYLWTWYDEFSPGFSQDEIILVNTSSDPVTVDLSFKDVHDPANPPAQVNDTHLLQPAGTPGDSWSTHYQGKMGGPVEVKAYKERGSWNTEADRRNIVATQRVVKDKGKPTEHLAEMPGIPYHELSSHYYWTWYDWKSPGAQNYVLAYNPGPDEVTVEVSFTDVSTGTPVQITDKHDLAPGAAPWTPFYPGKMGGPVEVKAYKKAPDGGPATSWDNPADRRDIIASQRSVWSTFFEEVPGLPQEKLSPSYLWTWYDWKSAGSQNWVMVANPNNESVTVEVSFKDQESGATVGGTPAPLAKAGPGAEPLTLRFDGYRGGPVEVKAYKQGGSWANVADRRNVISSQRVLWNGQFNETLGTVLE